MKQLGRILYLPVKMICKRQYNDQTFVRINERPIEYGFVFNSIRKLSPQKVLDVGTGKTALPQLMRDCGSVVTAIDNIRDYWAKGMVNRHYHVLDKDITSSGSLDLGGKFDLITCISVLEHVFDFDRAMENMFSLLNEGGHLVVTCPYTENSYYENVYKHPESDVVGREVSYVCQSFSRESLNSWLEKNDAEIVDQEYWQCWSGPYWRTGEPILPPVNGDAEGNHDLSCMLIRKNS